MHLGSMTDEELIALVRVRNELLVTDLETELAKRLAAAIDGEDEDRNLRKEIEEMTETNSDLSDQVRALEDKIADIQNIIKG